MMKNALVIFLFSIICRQAFPQARVQGIKLFVKEITKEGNKPITSGRVEVTLNDMIKQTLAPDAGGCVGVIALEKGSYNVRCNYQDCQAVEIRNIVVGEGKTAYVVMTLTCPAYLQSLTKREKKRLGIK